MAGSAYFPRILLLIGLIFAIAVYITLNASIYPFSGDSHLASIIQNVAHSKAPNGNPNRSNSTSKEEESIKFSKNECPNWYVSSKKMVAEQNLYSIENLNSKSTCSEAAASRGPNQRIVSFSFYGDIKHSRGYFKGIQENVKLVKQYYPNWVMRVYHDIPPMVLNQLSCKTYTKFEKSSISSAKNDSRGEEYNKQESVFRANITPQETLCYLMCTHSNLDLCYAGNIPGLGNLLEGQGNMWRFLPMADPLVDIFVSRDLDSRISPREMAAVHEWLDSNLTFHVMRDNRYHSSTILAGMWGAVIYKRREEMFNLTISMMMMGIKAKSKGLDQEVLSQVIWPVTKGSLVQHDSYFCTEFGKDRKVYPWPTKRDIDKPYNFVGSRVGIDSQPVITVCPEKCRPPNNKKWTYC